ncbi:MAG TPA: efflux RND transporter periplasmic adaptor subunit [Burkholderiales bacterium]|nr:efflux RND transporter periplasmic adaptor subunit [Burkholderiales bacterium]
MNQRRVLVMTAAACAAALLLAACHGPGAENGTAPAGAALRVATLKVEPKSVPEYASVPGTVAALQQVRIASRLTGYIERLAVRAGDSVKAGELLVAIDPADTRGQLAQAQAGLARAQATLADAASNRTRFANLYREGAATRQQYEGVERDYAAARSQVAAARAAVDMAHAQSAYAEIRAPFAGVIVERDAEAGDLATPGRTLLVMEDPARLEVRAQVDEATYAALAPDQTVPVRSGANLIEAKLAQRVPAGDPLSHTHLIKLALPPGAPVASGGYVMLEVPLGTRQALVVPASAVVTRAGIAGVFVVSADGAAQFRLVREGASGPAGIEIQAGLSAGETIVQAPDERIENGTRIAPDSHGGA